VPNRLGPILVLAALAGCADGATGLRVIVDTDYESGTDYARIEVAISSRGPGETTFSAVETWTPVGDEVSLPVTIGVKPRGGDARRVVRITAELAEFRAAGCVPGPESREINFEEGRVVDVHVDIRRCTPDGGVRPIIVPPDAGAATCDVDSPCGEVAVVGTGSTHTCALLASGHVLCWGDNSHGQLGDGTRDSREDPRPALVLGADGLAVGEGRTCAQREGFLFCWGDNSEGRLTGETEPSSDAMSPIPMPMGSAGGAALGQGHGCAIGPWAGVPALGSVLCWGGNDRGQVGRICGSASCLPGSAAGIVADRLAAGADHSCAIDGDHHVHCWGANDLGQLGDGTTVDRPVPTSIELDDTTEIVDITAGAEHSCALARDGTAGCWGANESGQLGIDAFGEFKTSAAPIAAFTFRRIRAGARHTCGVDSEGAVWCWGDNDRGQLGLDGGDLAAPTEPVRLDGTAVWLAAGGDHTCAIVMAAEAPTPQLYCWGDNSHGQLGVAVTGADHSAAPVVVPLP